MEFEIPESLATGLLGRIRADSPLAVRLHERDLCHGKRVVPSRLFDAAALNTFYGRCQAAGERSARPSTASVKPSPLRRPAAPPT